MTLATDRCAPGVSLGEGGRPLYLTRRWVVAVDALDCCRRAIRYIASSTSSGVKVSSDGFRRNIPRAAMGERQV